MPRGDDVRDSVRRMLTPWVLVRAGCAIVVLSLAGVELTGGKSTLIVAIQIVFLLGLYVTIPLDMRYRRRRRD
jgi:hypothetical protein